MNKFCNLLTNQYHMTYDQVKPCCWIKDTSSRIQQPEELKLQFKRLSEVTDWIPECEYCHTLEKSGAQSPRLDSLKSDLFSDSDKPGDSIKIEVQIDEDCNAACLMCSSYNSTTWKLYEEKTLKVFTKINDHATTVEQRFAMVQELVNFDTVKQIHFFGGEPFKTDTHCRVLELVTNPSEVNLVYVTNGSYIPNERTVELWDKFRHVNIAVSIDGTEEHFNYLRWPLQWDQLVDNLDWYCQHEFIVDVSVNTSFIATPFNMYYQDRYQQWAKKFFSTRRRINIGDNWFNYPNPVQGVMNLESVPPELQQLIVDKYGPNDRITQLIQPFDSELYKKFIDYVNYHDTNRKLNFRQVFPEVETFFKNQ